VLHPLPVNAPASLRQKSVSFCRKNTSKRSLRVQDNPGLLQAYNPVLDIYPTWDKGTFSVRFDIMAKPRADWFYEIREKGGEFADGPYIRCVEGKLVATNGQSLPLGDLKPGAWIRLTVSATTGAAEYDITFTRQDGSVKEFKDVSCKPTWTNASYMLFASLNKTDTACFIDSLSLKKR
jgi:hypothetical protein